MLSRCWIAFNPHVDFELDASEGSKDLEWETFNLLQCVEQPVCRLESVKQEGQLEGFGDQRRSGKVL